MNYMRRMEDHFRGYDNIELFYQSWEVDEARGTIVVTHGQAEHSECYNRLAESLATFGWNTIGWDLRGHGRSEGKRGYAGSFADYVKDLKIFSEKIFTNKKNHPYFLLGHSMGGLINTRALIDYGDMGFKAATFSSPALGLAIEVPVIKDMAAKILNRWTPSLTLNNEVKHEELSHDEEIFKSYDNDPLRHDRISLSVYQGMLENFDYVMLNANKITLPVFLQVAGDDLIASRKASERFYERIGSKQKDLKIYKGFYHEIFNEVDRQTVYNDLNQFLQGQLKTK